MMVIVLSSCVPIAAPEPVDLIGSDSNETNNETVENITDTNNQTTIRNNSSVTQNASDEQTETNNTIPEEQIPGTKSPNQ